MDVSSTELTEPDSMGNDLIGVLNQREDAGDTELHKPIGVQNHGSSGQPSGGVAKDGIEGNAIGGDAKSVEVERMDLEGGGEFGAEL